MTATDVRCTLMSVADISHRTSIARLDDGKREYCHACFRYWSIRLDWLGGRR
jgi:hypothetical protein